MSWFAGQKFLRTDLLQAQRLRPNNFSTHELLLTLQLDFPIPMKSEMEFSMYKACL